MKLILYIKSIEFLFENQFGNSATSITITGSVTKRHLPGERYHMHVPYTLEMRVRSTTIPFQISVAFMPNISLLDFYRYCILCAADD